jgi:hypothetical protein
MFATLRGALVDYVPGLARFIGGHYPNLPWRLWEFRLLHNRERLVVWSAATGQVSVRQTRASEWTVTADTTSRAVTDHVDTFNEALVRAYNHICALSSETNTEVGASFERGGDSPDHKLL